MLGAAGGSRNKRGNPQRAAGKPSADRGKARQSPRGREGMSLTKEVISTPQLQLREDAKIDVSVNQKNEINEEQRITKVEKKAHIAHIEVQESEKG